MNSYPDFGLAGQVALVTGAARGLGNAIARALAHAGADVALGLRDVNAPGDGVAQIEAMGRRALPLQMDMTRLNEIFQAVDHTVRQFGRLDILVNNAGLAPDNLAENVSEKDFDLTLATNLKSAFLCTQAVVPGMRERRWGRIVNISSGAARGAGGIGVHYNASKAGMEGLTRGYAARLVQDGITVNAVAPSLIDTDMMNARRDQYAARIPLGRMGTAEEVAQAVLMVAGNEYMTGQTVQLNGGTNFV